MLSPKGGGIPSKVQKNNIFNLKNKKMDVYVGPYVKVSPKEIIQIKKIKVYSDSGLKYKGNNGDQFCPKTGAKLEFKTVEDVKYVIIDTNKISKKLIKKIYLIDIAVPESYSDDEEWLYKDNMICRYLFLNEKQENVMSCFPEENEAINLNFNLEEQIKSAEAIFSPLILEIEGLGFKATIEYGVLTGYF